jgi:hypothetical protein
MTKETKKKVTDNAKTPAPAKAEAGAKTLKTKKVETVAAQTPVVKASKAKKAVTPDAPAVKAAVPAKKSVKTTGTSIIAKADIGFGNVLFLRGEGAGLSWDKGVALQSTAPDEWTWTGKSVKNPFEFKLLINDEIWAQGDNAVMQPGESLVIAPSF